jgi:hypothetical protein
MKNPPVVNSPIPGFVRPELFTTRPMNTKRTGHRSAIKRSRDFSIYTSVVESVDSHEDRIKNCHRFVLLENALNYKDSSGRWRESEDLIETCSTGAMARRGPNKATFNGDLNAKAVFDIEDSSGSHIAGGFRELRIVDAGGSIKFIAKTKEGARAKLLPPNQLVWEDCLDSLKVDLVLVWRHNFFAQYIILKERPSLPEGFCPATLELVTEFTECPSVKVTTSGDQSSRDDLFIHFGSFDLLPGRAFSLTGSLPTKLRPEIAGIHICKQWHKSTDVRAFLVESIPWDPILPLMKDLPSTVQPIPAINGSGSNWPGKCMSSLKSEPVSVAPEAYNPSGLALDFVMVPSTTFSTFETGTTYYIKSSFYSGAPVTFQPGCVIKYKDNAFIQLTAPSSHPDTLQTPVFTSRNDNAFGEKIAGVKDEPDSDGDPTTNMANPAIWSYHVNQSVIFKNERFRWCKTGIKFDTTFNHLQTIKYCLFEHITAPGSSAINIASAPNQHMLTLSGVQKVAVTTPVLGQNHASYSGAMTDAPFAAAQSFFAFRNSDSNNISERLRIPPDPMGAAGPFHYVSIVNRNVAIFGKDYGSFLEAADTSILFYGDFEGEVTDPRLFFDFGMKRWIATMLDEESGDVRVAISPGASPLGLGTWQKLNLSTAEPDWFPDFPTLGVDSNGIYIALRMTQGDPFNPRHWKYKIIPIKKPASGSISQYDVKPAIILHEDEAYKVSWIYPAVNFDAAEEDSVVWFLAKGDPGSAYGGIEYGRLQWVQDSPGNWHAEFLENPWSSSLRIPSGYAYYDLDHSQQLAVPQKPTPGMRFTPNSLIGSKLQCAFIRNGYLWTCHHIGLDGGGNNTYNGGVVDRTGIGWYRMKIKADNSLSLSPSDGGLIGRVYDPSPQNPYFYFFPSMMVNPKGDVVIAFSAARSTEYIGSLFYGRTAHGQTLVRPTLIRAGRDYFDAIRWGDYTTCAPDPVGDAVWTIQMYAEQYSDPLWAQQAYGLWVTKIVPNH